MKTFSAPRIIAAMLAGSVLLAGWSLVPEPGWKAAQREAEA
jgi:hypothetical protein